MIICNTTYQVDDTAVEEFIDWIKTQYLPGAIAPGQVSKPQLTRVMGSTHEHSTSYALQLQAPSLGVLQQWFRATGKDLNARLSSHFGTRAVSFTTLMEKIDL